MKFILKQCLMWSLPIIMYIMSIVLVCINGPTLLNNIMAWICCIILVIFMAYDSISTQYKIHKKYEQHKKQLDEEINKILSELDDLTKNEDNDEICN